uniref:Uncharacterized protein n=1 Tax=Aegilops tauschii TaxID=37682 RepID=N1QSW9_AEGTA
MAHSAVVSSLVVGGTDNAFLGSGRMDAVRGKGGARRKGDILLEFKEQGSGVPIRGRVWAKADHGSFEQDRVGVGAASASPPQGVEEGRVDFLKILKSANSIIPHVVLGSTILALLYPPSFTWFTTRNTETKWYQLNERTAQKHLNYLKLDLTNSDESSGVNSSVKDFIEAIKRPDAIAAGYIGQFIAKPFFGFLFGTLAVTTFNLPTAVAGYHLAGTWFRKSADVKALQRTISFETGMQSSLLALALANRFFPDPLVGVPPAVSVCLLLPKAPPVAFISALSMNCFDYSLSNVT